MYNYTHSSARHPDLHLIFREAWWLSGRVSDSRVRSQGLETYCHHNIMSLSKTLKSPKVLINYPGSSGSVLT